MKMLYYLGFDAQWWLICRLVCLVQKEVQVILGGFASIRTAAVLIQDLFSLQGLPIYFSYKNMPGKRVKEQEAYG